MNFSCSTLQCPKIPYTGNKTYFQRCMELCPSYKPPTIDENKIYVEWNGTGIPDVYEYHLGHWHGDTFETIEIQCGRDVIFTCVPNGDFAIVLVTYIWDSDGTECIKKFDICNFDCKGNPLPKGYIIPQVVIEF